MSDDKQLSLKDSGIERVLIQGDLSGMNEQQRISYVQAVCSSLGLNPLTKPFDYVKLNGKLVLYATKSAAEQLRAKHNVSITITSKEQVGDLFMVTAKARTPDGREDEDMGSVNTKGLSGDALSNAMLKAITRAKRRVTLSICGLGMIDESEVDSVQAQNPEREARRAEILNASRTSESKPEFQEIILEPDDAPRLGEYVFRTGKEFKGKKLNDIPLKRLVEFHDWIEQELKEGKTFGPDALADAVSVKEFLTAIDTPLGE